MDTASALGNEIEGSARWSLRLFGGFELSVLPGSERVALPRKRERVLMSYLALSPNCRTSRRKLATLLWGDATDETALENLRTEIWSVRKALGDAEHRVIASEGEDIVLDAMAFEVDVLMFRRIAARSDRSELEAAAKLYSGELLDGLGMGNEEFESWRRTQATRCRDQAIDVLNRLMTQLAELGETERAIEAGLRILEFDPLHEAAGRRLMRLYGGSGRRSAAVQLYRSLSDALKTDLDAQPEAETRALYAEITQGGGEPPAVPDVQAPPFPRLRPPSDASREPQPAEHVAPTAGAPQKVAPRQVNTKTLGWILAGGLAAVMAIFLFYQFAPPAGTTTAQQTSVDTAKAAAFSPVGAVSIVVLPFNNLSSDAEQEFFADGMTEEITSALAKIPGLRVVGRTSAYEFKGAGKDLRSIGQALNATHLIEGSVRKAGTRVRITAQLIAAGDGTHVWSESYDRELTDVFAIQEDIAKAIAEALKVPLGLAPGESLVANRSIDPDSYQRFLRARTILRSRGGQAQADVENRYAGAIEMLEQVVARDPSYAPAWALLAMMMRDPDKSQTAAREAIRLDSRNAAAHGVLASYQNFLGNFAVSEDLARQALPLDPNEPEALNLFASLLTVAGGRIKEALSIRERLRTVEPFIPVYNIHTANLMLMDGQNEAAIAILEALPAGAGRNISLAHVYAAEGRYGEAADILLTTPLTDRQVSRQSIEDAARLLRSAPTKVKAPQDLPVFPNQLSYVYAYIGAIGALDRGLDNPERLIAEGKHLILAQGRHLWDPEYAPVRKTERFKAFVRKAGYVDYWRAKGWPDRCRPVGADDFACD